MPLRLCAHIPLPKICTAIISLGTIYSRGCRDLFELKYNSDIHILLSDGFKVVMSSLPDISGVLVTLSYSGVRKNSFTEGVSSWVGVVAIISLNMKSLSSIALDWPAKAFRFLLTTFYTLQPYVNTYPEFAMKIQLLCYCPQHVGWMPLIELQTRFLAVFRFLFETRPQALSSRLGSNLLYDLELDPLPPILVFEHDVRAQNCARSWSLMILPCSSVIVKYPICKLILTSQRVAKSYASRITNLQIRNIFNSIHMLPEAVDTLPYIVEFLGVLFFRSRHFVFCLLLLASKKVFSTKLKDHLMNQFTYNRILQFLFWFW